MGCYSALKGNKILIHATTWMNLKDFMLNEIKWVTQLCWILCNPMDYSPWNSPGQNTGVGSHSLLQGIFLTQVSRIAGGFFTSWAAAAAAKSLQLCLTLCDPIDGSPPGPAILGILQARTLEWVAISFSSAWKWNVKVKLLSHARLFTIPWPAAYQAPPSMGFSRQEYWSGVPLFTHICVSFYTNMFNTVAEKYSLIFIDKYAYLYFSILYFTGKYIYVENFVLIHLFWPFIK